MKTKSFFAALMLLFCTTSLWASDTSVDGIWYDFNSSTKTATVTYQGSKYSAYSDEYSGNVTIPASVTYSGENYSVTSIGYGAFEKCSSLTSVTIPNSVTSIGEFAFYNCSGLTSVTIHNSGIRIRSRAFGNCSGLTKVNITDIAAWCHIVFDDDIANPLYYAKHLFVNDVEVTDLVIPNSVTSIGDYAFYYCSGLTSVTIPNSVTSIGSSAFRVCSSLASVTIGNSVTSIENYAFYGCSGLTSVTIPNSVTSIGEAAFLYVNNIIYSGTATGSQWGAKCVNGYVDGCLVYSDATKTTLLGCSAAATGTIVIPNSVTSIGEYAFYQCSSLTSVTIPNSVTSIGEAAFYNCSGLTSVTIGNSVTSIGYEAFWGCSSLTSVTIPNSVTSIRYGAFNECSSLTAIYVPCGEMERFKQMLSDSRINDHEPLPYTITINATNGHVTYPQTKCDDMLLTANPNYGYHFTQWSDGNTDNPRTFELTRDTTFTAEFAKNTYTISTTSANPEWGTTAGGKSALYLDKIEISATANYGYHFSQWNDGNTNNPRTVSVTEDKTYTARFVKNTYSITKIANNEQGSISGPMQGEYLDKISLTANPKYGYYFTQWSDGVTDNPRTIELSRDTTFTALFAKKPTILYIYDSSKGNVSGPLLGMPDEIIIVTATSNYGYHFTQWSDGNTDNPREFVLTQDTTFTAEFAVDQSGVCGDDNLLTWTFDDESKTLAISGEGTLNSNYTFGVEAPTQTERLIIAEGVTSVGNNAFNDMSSIITSLALPSTVTEIGDYAFAGMNNRKFNTLVLPNTIIRIGAHAFDGASYLQTIHFGSTLEEIGDYAFNGCTRVKQMTCLAEITPNVGTDGLTSISDLAELYVPIDYMTEYQIDNNWKRFVLKPYGATETTVTDNSVIVVADDNTATFTWPTNETADSYTIDITKDGVVFCQLIFNANGQLTGIAFAPSRNGQSMSPAATVTASGMQFTVTGLNSGTSYAFNLTVKNGSAVIESYTGTFATTGMSMAVDDIQSENATPYKFFRDNQVLILRAGKTYTLQGVEVK